MAVSAYQLHRMVQETLRDACAAPENWMELLRTVAPFYKYDFSSALQITAQRPDATACATMRQWNRHNLWIRRGSRAIYTVDPQRPYYVQRVFDISDINARPDRLPPIWRLRDEDHAQVFGMLREEWQGPNREDESWLKLYELILDATEVVSPDHRNAFEALRPMSALAELAPEEAENTFASLTAASAFVIATERLGIELPEEITADILTDIQFFDTPEIQLTIGNAAHETAEAVLRQIERAVRIVDNSRLRRDNELVENIHTIPTEERMVEYGNQVAGNPVHRGRERYAGADDRVSEAARGQYRQVRRDAPTVHDGVAQGDLSADDAERDAEEVPDGRKRSGEPDAGSADRAAAGDAARAGQGNEPDGLGAAHEQPEGAGGGNRPARTDLRINEEPQQIHIPVEPSHAPGSISVSGSSEQLSMFGAMSFALPQEYVDRVLAEGGNGRHSASRIVAHFKKDFPIEESAAFLQREFRTGGRGVVVDGRRVSAWWNASGMRLACGDSAQTEGAMIVSWMQAAKRIGELLDAGRFMAQDDLDMVDYLERREMAERICNAYRDDLNGIAPIWNPRVGFPDEVAQVIDLLDDPAQRDRVILQFQSDLARADADNPKRRRWHNMQQLEHDLLSLQRPSRTYTANDPIETPEARFITQDEVDLELCGGNHVENGKFRIFAFYQAAHSAREQADYLKESYGIGGHSHACGGADDAWENHDAKGILLRRGDFSNPSAEVRLNWTQAAKSIGELIASNRYLTADELEKYKLQQEEKNRIVEIPAVPKAYDLGFGSLGNGTTVWNRLEERDGDYRTVAHISDDGNVSFYDPDMPPEIIDRIHAVAERQHEKSQTLLDPKTWIEDMVAEYGDEIVRQVQEDRDGAALHSQEELESAMNRILPETLQQNADVYRAYMDDADFRKRLTAHVLERIPVEPEPPLVVEPAIEPVEPPAAAIAQLEADDSPEVAAAISTYAHYQQAYPQHLVFAQVGDHYETYGTGAETAHEVLNTCLLERATPNGETVSMTGFDPASRWPSQMMKLRTAGHDVAIIGLNEQGGYELVKEGKAADLAPVGAQFEADDHTFTVDSVNFRTGHVRLKDETMFSSGYPIFRDEPLEWVHAQIEAQADDRVKLRSTVIDLRPRDPEPSSDHAPARNYRIHDDHLGEGGERTKADRNIAAIRTLRQIEAEDRAAGEEEQEILAQYVGWGGIPQIFDEANTDWKERHDRLQSLLTDDEYASARASTLNAHYTSPVVIRSIYQALENMGFRQGSILEPACGVGNFFGMLPESMAGSRLYGVELDSLTGHIAQKLYPEAKISVQGFEHSVFPDNYFDAAVGNVPFGAYSLADTRYDRYHFRIHDYFFAKALDKVRPGGVIAFVTSKGTLDKQDSSVRRYLAQRAELLGAIRLPNNAFLANAGTGVTTDILFLQKRERQIDVVPEWVDVGRNEAGVPVNQYFLDHPEMVLGVMAFDKSMYGNAQETTCHPIEGAALSEQLSAAIRNIHGRYEETHIDAPAADSRLIPANPEVPNFSYAVQDGSVYYRHDSLMERQELSAADDQRMRGMIGLRDLTRELIQAQLEGASDAVVGDLQLKLKERYEAFSSRFGLLSDRRNAQVFREDDGYYLLTSLEILDEEHKLQRLADMFTKRTIAQNRPIDHVDSAAEALAVSMAERAAVDLDFMADLTDKDRDVLISELKGLIYQDPGGNPAPYEKWQTADEYLSGDVRQKLERTKKSLEARLKKLNDDSDKDSVITFEELGVDMLYVDEAHGYKNLAVVTKMRNVAGINTMEAKKSSDMYMKTRYLSDLTGNRGVVFATGTPISNSMTELYTMQRYLQQSTLKRHGLSHFDSWAANFGETVTAIELAPEGTGYRMKTRFSKFFNLPELMSMFKQIADIQTPDMLNLPVPTLKGGKTQNIRTEASEYQKRMVAALGERADAVRSGSIDPREDNMLKITNDGRLLALDARLIDPTLPDDPNSKVNTCVREVLRIYEEGTPQKLTQMIFCDLSTPRAERTDGGFDDVYHDLRRKLIRGGVPEGEIAFIHDANTEAKKDELFAKVRSGAVRVLIGSTAKMGAGTNAQTKLKALHHLDCPWRPSDLQQRDGCILRQGNTNSEVEIIRYITQDTFDAYSYQLVENKQKFIAQVCTSKSPARGAEDLDEMALSYAEVKALAAGNPAIREKMDLDVQVSRLKLLKSNWQSERYRLERRVGVELPGEIARLETRIRNMESDIQLYNDHRPSDAEGFSIALMDSSFDKRADAGERLMKLLSLVHIGESMKAGIYCGFTLRLSKPDMLNNPRVEIQGGNSYYVELGDSPLGNIQRIENAVEGIVQAKERDERSLSTARGNLADAKAELDKPWPLEQELQEKSARLTALNIELDVGGSDTGAAALADDEDEPEPSRNRRGRDAER